MYSTNFEKQKVSLAFAVFNEKTINALRGLKTNSADETTRFIELVVDMWNCLNIKCPGAGQKLQDPNREKFTEQNDARLDFLKDMATMFKQMDTYSPSTHVRLMGLTTDTSNAFHLTLNGISSLITLLLTKMNYAFNCRVTTRQDRGRIRYL